MPANRIVQACALAAGFLASAPTAGQAQQTRTLADLAPETRAAYRRAVNLCSDFVHAEYLTADETAAAGVAQGFTRGSNPPMTQEHIIAYETLGLRSPEIHIHIQVYAFPAGRRSTCGLFLPGADNATFQALLADYITRTGTSLDSGDWLNWTRSTGNTFTRYDRTNEWTGSELYALTISNGPQTLNFVRNDPQGMPLDAFDDW